MHAAPLVRRLERLLGLAKIDDELDRYKLTTIIKVILARFGVR